MRKRTDTRGQGRRKPDRVPLASCLAKFGTTPFEAASVERARTLYTCQPPCSTSTPSIPKSLVYQPSSQHCGNNVSPCFRGVESLLHLLPTAGSRIGAMSIMPGPVFHLAHYHRLKSPSFTFATFKPHPNHLPSLQRQQPVRRV